MIQPLAYVDPTAKIAKKVTIDPFTTIASNVEIGEGTWIGSNVTIMEGARIGKNCSIFPGSVISAIPQDLKYKGEDTILEVGDNTTIREFVTLNRGTADRMKTKIGENCLIMAYSHVAHDCVIGNNCILSNNSTLAGHVVLGDYVTMAGVSGIQQFCSVGSHTFITAGSFVRKDVPPFVKAGREPLCFIGVNSVGLRRRGFISEKISEIQHIYKILYQQNYNISNAVDIIEKEVEATNERDEILMFVRNSQRGIMKGV